VVCYGLWCHASVSYRNPLQCGMIIHIMFWFFKYFISCAHTARRVSMCNLQVPIIYAYSIKLIEISRNELLNDA